MPRAFKQDLTPATQCVSYTKSLIRYGYYNVRVFPAPDIYFFNKYLTFENNFMAGLLDRLMSWNDAACMNIETLPKSKQV